MVILRRPFSEGYYGEAMKGGPPQDVTQLLRRWQQGDEEATEALLPLIYGELRKIARRHLRGERHGHTLEATALVHEVYLRLSGGAELHWNDRVHFYAVAAQMMRRGGGGPRPPPGRAAGRRARGQGAAGARAAPAAAARGGCPRGTCGELMEGAGRDRWRRVQELFEAAADLRPGQQAAYLATACAGDDELRREVEALLRSDAEAGSFIEHAIRRGSDLLLAAEPDPLAALGKIGKYEILGRIGARGCGGGYNGPHAVVP